MGRRPPTRNFVTEYSSDLEFYEVWKCASNHEVPNSASRTGSTTETRGAEGQSGTEKQPKRRHIKPQTAHEPNLQALVRQMSVAQGPGNRSPPSRSEVSALPNLRPVSYRVCHASSRRFQKQPYSVWRSLTRDVGLSTFGEGAVSVCNKCFCFFVLVG